MLLDARVDFTSSFPRLAQPVHLLGEAEAIENVTHGGGEAADICGEVGEQVVLVAHERLQVEGRRVDEAELGDTQQEGFGSSGSMAAFSASTTTLVEASTQSSRRSTVKGRITRPYSDGL